MSDAPRDRTIDHSARALSRRSRYFQRRRTLSGVSFFRDIYTRGASCARLRARAYMYMFRRRSASLPLIASLSVDSCQRAQYKLAYAARSVVQIASRRDPLHEGTLLCPRHKFVIAGYALRTQYAILLPGARATDRFETTGVSCRKISP